MTIQAQMCGARYGHHPTQPDLEAVCTLPAGHDGPHDNVLSRGGIPEHREAGGVMVCAVKRCERPLGVPHVDDCPYATPTGAR